MIEQVSELKCSSELPTSLSNSALHCQTLPSSSCQQNEHHEPPHKSISSLSLTRTAMNAQLVNTTSTINTSASFNLNQVINIDETPNKIVYKKIESIIEKMQDEVAGVPIKTVKSFMSKIPSVFTGVDLIQWIMKNLDVEDAFEALHFSHLVSSHGYIFPIDDHILTVKNDGTFYRFQVSEIVSLI